MRTLVDAAFRALHACLIIFIQEKELGVFCVALFVEVERNVYKLVEERVNADDLL